MKIFGRVVLVLSALSFAACSSAPKAPNVAESTFKISVEAVENDAKAEYGAFDVRLENESGIRAEGATVELVADAPHVTVLEGDALEAWAAERAETLDELAEAAAHDTPITAETAKSRISEALEDAEETLPPDTIASMTLDTLASAQKKSELPARHLAQPISLPANMFTRRWIVIKKPSGTKLDSLAFRVKTPDGKIQVLKASL